MLHALFQPIRSKTDNQSWHGTRAFSRAWRFDFWLAHCVICVCCDWPDVNVLSFSRKPLSITSFAKRLLVELPAFCQNSMANRPFSSCLLPLFQNESKCEMFQMKMNFTHKFIQMQIKLIFTWKVSHLDSFWNRGRRQLGNGGDCCGDSRPQDHKLHKGFSGELKTVVC